ncbi:MAG: hypothetical protein VKJ02_12520 [Snowella sp.]|nr:hypothetical protein [Snowella sp.]
MSKSGLTKKITNYLSSLTKEELINLILKFAPQSFFDAIESQLANQSEAIEIFNRVQEAIGAIFSDDTLLYSPKAFEDQLFGQFNKLSGLWARLPLEIGDLILTTIEDIEEAFEEGYLYIENYDKEDEFFESEDINNYIIRFVRSLPNDMQAGYLKRLMNVLEQSGYSTFMSVQEALS